MKYNKSAIETAKKKYADIFDKMAMQLTPISGPDFNKLAEKLDGKKSYWSRPNYVYDVNDMGLIQKVPYQGYALSKEMLLECIERLAKEKNIMNRAFPRNNGTLNFGVTDISFGFYLFCEMLKCERGEAFLEDDRWEKWNKETKLQYLNDIFFELITDPQWEIFSQKMLASKAYDNFMDDYNEWHLNMKQPDVEHAKKLYIDNPYIKEDVRTKIYDGVNTYDLLLLGHIEDIPSKTSTHTYDGIMQHAIYDMYHGGSYSDILERMEKARTMGEEESEWENGLFNIPIYDMFYILALRYEGCKASQQKLKAISKLQEEEEYMARLWALYALHADVGPTKRKIERDSRYMNRMDTLLSALAIRYYEGVEEGISWVREEEEILSKSGWGLLQMEYFSNLPTYEKFANTIKEQLKLESILKDGFVKRPKWEEFLDSANSLLKPSSARAGKKTNPSAEQARIIYLLNGESFQPKLQKSKDGVTWSKGRNIALSTFHKGIPEMSALDNEISRLVKRYSGGWGYGEYYDLSGKKVFDKLVGHPNVIDEYSELPVTITRENLQITVERTKTGFKLHTNVGENSLTDNMVLVKENSQLFKVVSVTKQQRTILEMMNGINVFPLDAEKKLVGFLEGISREATVFSDLLKQKDDVKSVKADSRITVRLLPVGEGMKAELFVKPLTDIPPYCKPGKGIETVVGNRNGKSVQTSRNIKKEKENLSIINNVCDELCSDMLDDNNFIFDTPTSCLELLDHLRENTEYSIVEWPEGARFRITKTLLPKDIHLSVKGAAQWFEVDGEVKISDSSMMKIGELLEKFRNSQGRFIALGDNEFLSLSEQLRKQLAALDMMASKNRKKMHISAFSTSALEDLEKSGVELKADKKYKSFRQQIEESEHQTFTLPKGIQAELREYQKDGVRWMARLASWGAGACLADDMGLGKTLQSIVMLQYMSKQGASLVVVPTSVLFNWRDEIQRFTPKLNPILLHAQNQDRQKTINEASSGDVIITTYGLLITEQELLCSREWNMIILDEAHTIKNKETKMSQSAMQLQGKFRLMLTGTPLQNHLGEIWNLFQFSNPGLLGTNAEFQEKFILPIERDGNKERQHQLRRLLLPFLLRRTKNEVLDELPIKSEITINVELSDDEMAFYEHLRQQAVINLEEQSNNAMETLAEITRLRQAACNPALVEQDINIASSKTAAFLEKVDELIGSDHRALVFSQFTSHLALVRKELEKRGIEYLYLDGSTSTTERNKLVEQFQKGDMPLFLISLKAGGTGLNLTAADYVFHLDPWWNPAIEDQASDRTYRIGQTRPVTIYRLIASHTIEEKIVQLHKSKKSLADSLLEGSNMSHKLSREEILELLR